MEKFKEIKKIGDGSFGSVLKAQDIQTKELVAIKKMKQKYSSWEECMNLRELKALQKLKHINIIKLKEVIRLNDELSFVFEFIDKNILQIYQKYKDQGKAMPEDLIRSIIYQSANALAYMHKHGFFHRDLKPENILMNQEGIIKIIDFGLAREIRSRPPYTDYVATRWYRAPEILLKQPNYNSPVDIFALGCIMSELYLNRPLFQGSSEMDQLTKIVSVLGTFSQSDWPEGSKLLSQRGMTLASYPSIQLNNVIKNAHPDAINLISQMLKYFKFIKDWFRWDPQQRITAQQILLHPFLGNSHSYVPSQVFGKENLSKSTPPHQLHQLRQKNNMQDNMSDEEDYDYEPSFGNRQKDNQKQFSSNQKVNNGKQYQNKERGRQIRQQKGKPRVQTKFQIKQCTIKLRQKEKELESQELDEMLEMINQTTKDEPKFKQKRNEEQAFSSYQPTQFGSKNTKSQMRLQYPNEQQEFNGKERDNSLGNDYGEYMPSQLQKKQPSGLQLPNSIYNFDNVSYQPGKMK